MSPQRIQILENPSPGTIALLLILSITLLVLGDVSARAGRAEAWNVLCGPCDQTAATTRAIPVSTGARDDVTLSFH